MFNTIRAIQIKGADMERAVRHLEIDRRRFLIGSAALVSTTAMMARVPAFAAKSFTGGGGTTGVVPFDAYLPPGTGPFPVIVAIHGGNFVGGVRANCASACEDFRAAGYTAITPSYTLATGLEPSYPTAAQDIVTLIAAVRQNPTKFKADPYNVGIYGTSAGGSLCHVVATLATGTGRPDCVVSMSGGADFRYTWYHPKYAGNGLTTSDSLVYFIGCTPTENSALWAQASPQESVASNHSPTLLINSQNELVDVSDPTNYQAALTACGVSCQMTIYPGRRHGADLFPVAEPEVIAYFDSMLKQ